MTVRNDFQPVVRYDTCGPPPLTGVTRQRDAFGRALARSSTLPLASTRSFSPGSARTWTSLLVSALISTLTLPLAVPGVVPG